jgi:hypothetical protein
MAKKDAAKNPFAGRWRIVSMSAWEDDYLDEEVEAYIEFDAKGVGDFQFGYVQGQIDYRIKTRDGKPAVEFSWEGCDGADGTPLTGRAWAILDSGELHGEFCIWATTRSS